MYLAVCTNEVILQPPSSLSCASLHYLVVLLSPNYTAPRFEGPYNSSNCSRILRVPVYNLYTDASYSAYIVAYNNSVSFKSTLFHFSEFYSDLTHTYYEFSATGIYTVARVLEVTYELDSSTHLGVGKFYNFGALHFYMLKILNLPH